MENKEEKKSFDLRGESKEFAFRSIRLYQYLTEHAQKKEYNLSKQFLIAGTRIGDLIRQEQRLDAYHSASSAKYWLELLQNGGYLTEEQASSMLDDSLRLVKYLYVISHPESRKEKEDTVSSSFATGKSQKGGAL